MNVNEYLDGLSGRRVTVVGIGVSNTPLIKMLLRAGVRVTACDKKTRGELGGAAEELESLGARLCLGPSYLDELDGEVIFRSPGMHPGNPALRAAAERGAEISSEMEAFFELCPCLTIGVTGSDGKTTTTTLISEFFKADGKAPYVGGNIGKPLLPDVGGMVESDSAILELSSFQLMTMNKSPHIAVVTNLAPNHLDVHSSMAEYVAAKERIYQNQTPNDLLVVNMDNDITRAFAEHAPGRVSMFSMKQRPERGVWCSGGEIYRVSPGQPDLRIMSESDILLPGRHNVENYMAAICAVEGLVSDEAIRTVAASFQGVEHRIELVRRLRGVSYYNDSIASSPSRTIAGLLCFHQKVILIAGGYDKHIPYDALGPVICQRVKTLVLTGATAPAIRAAVTDTPGYDASQLKIIHKPDFFDAVYAACAEASDGDIVILSPASASFDRFKNFAQRGEAFKKVIYELN